MEQIFVKDYITENCNDSDVIKECLTQWHKIPDKPTIVFDGREWNIDEAIILSSGMTVVIDGCTIRQNDYVFDNVFRGDNVTVDPDNEYGKPLSVSSISDIKILGRNGAEIIGCERNKRGWHSVLGVEQDMTGDFWGWRTIQICLSKCDGIEIGGFSMEKTRCWAISFDMCSNGYIHDICFDSHVKNGDGIDLRAGCHHFRVENITGYTSDDTVACTALWTPNRTYPHKNYLYPLAPALSIFTGDIRDLDIHNVRISGIYTGGNHHGIICLAANGLRVYNIRINDVREANDGAREATVKIYTGYGDGYNPGDLHDITVNGVTSYISDSAVMCNTKVENVVLFDINQEKTHGKLYNIFEPTGITINS